LWVGQSDEGAFLAAISSTLRCSRHDKLKKKGPYFHISLYSVVIQTI